MRKTFLTILLLLILSSLSSAQSQYLKNDENGVELGVGMQTFSLSDGNASLFSIAYGVHGLVDLGVEFGKLSGTTIISPKLNFALFRPNEKKSTDIRLTGFFKPEFYKYKNFTKTSMTVGGIIAQDFVNENGLGTYPYFMYSYTMVESANASGYGAGISIHFGKKTTSSFNFGFLAIEEQTSFIFSYTILFKHKTKTKYSETYDLQ